MRDKVFTVLDISKVDRFLKAGAVVPVDMDTTKLLIEAVKYYKSQSFHAMIPNYFGAKL